MIDTPRFHFTIALKWEINVYHIPARVLLHKTQARDWHSIRLGAKKKEKRKKTDLAS
jgi:TfoX/Sxy family transcriptional regulator of competence genes